MPQKTIDILKEAILLERRGQAFYSQAAAQSRDPSVRAFFKTMAAEEQRHINVLGEQYKSFVQSQSFAPLGTDLADDRPLADLVLSAEVKQRIAAADFEAAAISAAVLMEERAVQFYGQRAATARDPNEKALFAWLSRWEQGHLSFLNDLDREIKAAIWNDNRFWPF